MSWLSKQFKSIKKAVIPRELRSPLTKFWHSNMDVIKKGSDLGYNLIGQRSPRQRQAATDEANRQEVAARQAAHDAEVAQLAKDSLGAVSLRRRRGAYSMLLTGQPPLMGGKSALG